MPESDWHHLTGEVPRVTAGGLQAALTRAETAKLMITVAKERARTGPPPLFTSANGEVLSHCSSSSSLRSLFEPHSARIRAGISQDREYLRGK
jgi:hypothetical protein